MGHWTWSFCIDYFIMELVIVLFWRLFAAIFLISCSKGSTGFVLSRGFHTPKVYFVIPDSPDGMAPTARYEDEPDRADHKNEIEQPLNGIPQGQYQVNDNDQGIVNDMQVLSADVQDYQQTLGQNNGTVLNNDNYSGNFIKRNQLVIGPVNPYKVDQGELVGAKNSEELSEEEVYGRAIVPKKREEENLNDEDFFLSVIPLAKPPTNTDVEGF